MVMVFLALTVACESEKDARRIGGDTSTQNDDTQTGQMGDTSGFDPETDSQGTLDDTGSDSESASEVPDLTPDCSACPSIGGSLDHMACAVELCGEMLVEQSYESPTGHVSLEETFEAMSYFGNQGDLAPRAGDSYAVLKTGDVESMDHSEPMKHPDLVGGLSCIGNHPDPFAYDAQNLMCEVVEWRLRLKAPEGAKGFSFDYVFFSTEYDEYVGSKYNDRFYAFIEAPSTNGGARTVINYTGCRANTGWSDFRCEDDDVNCEKGEDYCYIAVNTALSECCWLGDCEGAKHTDISGSGFECAPDRSKECLATDGDGYCRDYKQTASGAGYGSSTGWLRTEWDVEPGEEFTVIFHLHDTSDFYRDSQVIIDNFVFKAEVEAGKTDPIVVK